MARSGGRGGLGVRLTLISKPMPKRKPTRRTPDEIIADLEAQIAEVKQRAKAAKRFSPKAVRAERERLELSAADYAELVGVSHITIYNWEHGRSSPRKAQLERLAEIKGISQKKAWDELGIEEDDGFSPDDVARERERLGLSAADYGELVGVSMVTIYNWEKGKSRPRAAQLERLAELKGIGKRKAWRRLGHE